MRNRQYDGGTNEAKWVGLVRTFLQEFEGVYQSSTMDARTLRRKVADASPAGRAPRDRLLAGYMCQGSKASFLHLFRRLSIVEREAFFSTLDGVLAADFPFSRSRIEERVRRRVRCRLSHLYQLLAAGWESVDKTGNEV